MLPIVDVFEAHVFPMGRVRERGIARMGTNISPGLMSRRPTTPYGFILR
jgi:hypothetical protein